MIVKVTGKVDGKEVIFDHTEGDQWKITVPLDLDGMYVIEVIAEDNAGNVAYCTKMLLIVDPATLCVKIVALDDTVELIREEYTVDVVNNTYEVEAVYPIHGRGRCCE